VNRLTPGICTRASGEACPNLRQHHGEAREPVNSAWYPLATSAALSIARACQDMMVMLPRPIQNPGQRKHHAIVVVDSSALDYPRSRGQRCCSSRAERTHRASLGGNENPHVISDGTGQFLSEISDDQITFELSYDGLADVQRGARWRPLEPPKARGRRPACEDTWRPQNLAR
jgi:hypothetical protein